MIACFTGVYFSCNDRLFGRETKPIDITMLCRGWTPVASKSIYVNSAEQDRNIKEEFFKYFNWQHEEKGLFGYAGDDVNACVRANQCHASMSVGDVLQITSPAGVEYYYCGSFDWTKLHF